MAYEFTPEDFARGRPRWWWGSDRKDAFWRALVQTGRFRDGPPRRRPQDEAAIGAFGVGIVGAAAYAQTHKDDGPDAAPVPDGDLPPDAPVADSGQALQPAPDALPPPVIEGGGLVT
jgi:hypothetical protein